MTTQVKPIPDGCHTVSPYLTVHDADAALSFYKQAFGANEVSVKSTAMGETNNSGRTA